MAPLLRRRQPAPATLSLTWPWWLHPGWALIGLTGTLAVVSCLLPDEDFALWNTQKFLDGTMAPVLFVGICAMLLGILLAGTRLHRGGSREVIFSAQAILLLRRSYAVLFTLTLVGYAIWAASAFQHGVRAEDLTAVLDRQAGALGELKGNSRPISGLTTLTQLGPVAVAIGAIMRRLGQGGRSYYLLFAAAAVRTVFYAERLALMELAVPLAVITAITVGGGSRAKQLLARLAPLFIGPAVWALFAISEYTRSWVFYQNTTSLPFQEWVTMRLLGYYTTAFNNSALFAAAHEGTYALPYFSFPVAWNIPLVDSVVPYPGIHGTGPEEWWMAVLQNNASVELNNVGSFLVTYGELGILGMVLFWMLVGMAMGRLHRSIALGSAVSVIAYASLFVGILELPRFIYWTQGRAFPVLASLLVLWLVYPKKPTDAEGPGVAEHRHGRLVSVPAGGSE
ncbi:hypothetical protein SCMU_28780 [Sinomonas cyclohexanicum]|uniref:Oligosaccharide repeat unit polymerase n=1 Tax=Sinomonas cyclohexanicum TaxID=322009 RepID=A0ABM7PXK7_SINCY|nr:hypothetical protein [Corynebacterium cyclohexanicum]BCT77036.1 hypothetical protein SCMU_28780 [Corynebacterium cyclohexanicum]